ncbi:MAG: chromosome segregation protein SMC [Lewinellaceae bacterium]|nr:chromosome segregation protein SMC [Phaeodactylibacter sp.]MCB9349055.1 chromosome segregation protein SMC [Lewinellaceae bacterium]
MRLKQLEIKGFKSFANETVINFNEDVIGIVGPNGSGKSNIVDAIRWVLGEQKSRELRLDQMSSVIFNGTKRRKAGGVAQVCLTFENTKNLLPTEYNTVAITRMLYRSGESEYRLNGVPCRLKDITSLFLDTGIGSNSYAIIALGMVDDILSDKDNSRRRMFEQAAGVSKYKVRKRETLNKLKNTSDDLERVEDLLFEINNNLKSLEKQAKRTQRYFELKAKYKDYSTNLAILKISSLKERQNELRKKLETEEGHYRQYEVEISKLESALERERKDNLDKEKALSDRQRELNNLVGNIRGMENDKRMYQQKQQFLEENQSKLTEDIRNTKARIQQLEQDIEYYRSELNQEKRLETTLEEGLTAAEEKLAAIRKSHGALKEGLDEVVARQQALERQAFELEKQKAINTNQAESNQNNLERYTQEIEQRSKEVGGLREKMNVLEAEERQKSEALANLARAEEERQERLQQAEAELEELTKKMTRVNREMDAKRNEYKLTKSMVENLEGFPESIRFLSTTKSSEWDKDTPLLSDLIYVKEEYRVAIENYLEPYLNYYVVPNMEAAYRAIQLLSKTQKGKANFFLLDAFHDYVAPMALLPDTTRAIDLVETDPAYRNLCSYLLEKVLLTVKEEIQHQLPEGDFVLLSQSGRYIQRRYSVSGGSIGLFEGKKIGRKKNLEVLDSAIKKLEREENRLSTEFYSLKSKIEGLKAQRTPSQIQQEQAVLNRLMQEKAALGSRLENFESFIREADDKRAAIERAVQKLEESNLGIEAALKEKNKEVAAVKDQIANTDVNFRQVAEEMSEASSVFNNKNIEFVRQQNKVSSFQRELSFREKQLEEARSTVASNQTNLERSAEEVKAIQDSTDTLEKQLQEAYAQRKEKESLLTEAEQNYFQARGGINEQEDKLRKLNKQRQDAQVLVNNLKDKTNDLKFEISSVAQRLRIEFNIDINTIINEEASVEIPQEELEMKVERLRGRLENYGEINPMAVEAYDEMKERYESITLQRDDILKAKQSLEDTIKEIEETATAQFLEAFEKARLFFIDVFRSLFTEDDNCDLILVDPSDPLESKIEIVAKPKGKRPQTINQLSGGEKTLTATALLFALYLLKPAPFCIFDEVDAPLDDANIEKFNKIIKKFSKDSQFIIVTHNKLTMAAVDTIYGVYMAEQGVSGVSPVDFRDFEHTTSFEVVGN